MVSAVSTEPSPATGIRRAPGHQHRRGTLLGHRDAHAVREVGLDHRTERMIGKALGDLRRWPPGPRAGWCCRAPRASSAARGLRRVLARQAGHLDLAPPPPGRSRAATPCRPDQQPGQRQQHDQPPPMCRGMPPQAPGQAQRPPGRASRAGAGRPRRRRSSSYSPSGRRHRAVCTSGSSSTPNRSRTRGGPRPSARPRRRWWPGRGSRRSWRASRRSRAPPTVSPRQPASSSSTPALRPSARGSSGFLKVRAEGLDARRLGRPAAGAHVGKRGLQASAVGVRQQRTTRAATTSRGPRLEWR